MNKENPILQRDQLKRPSFYKLVHTNSNSLSSPFPFMEFGLSTQSSLNNVLHNFHRENGNSTKLIPPKVDQQDQKKSITIDPYLKPLTLDRLKSASPFSRDNGSMQYSHNFMRISSNNLRNNDFSDNFFLRIQSTRTNNAENVQKKCNEISKNSDLSKIVNETNDLTEIIRHKRPISSILTPRNLTASNMINKESAQNPNGNETGISKSHQIRPTTASAILKLSKDIPNGSIATTGSSPYMRFHNSSLKTDSLIYNPTVKSAAKIAVEKQADISPQTTFKSQNSLNLYLQVKQEVEEYRQQLKKDSTPDMNPYATMRAISTDDLFANNEPGKDRNGNISNKVTPSKVSDTNGLPHGNTKTSPTEQPKANIDNGLVSVINPKSEKESNCNKSCSRPKSVTFNEHVETRDFFGDSSTTESEDEDSNEVSSTDNESHGSIVSNDSESEENDHKPQNKQILQSKNSSPIDSAIKHSTNSTSVEYPEEINNINSDKENDSMDDKNETHLENEIETTSISNSDDSDAGESLTTINSSSKADSECDIDKLNEKTTPKINGDVSSRTTSATSSSVATSSRQSVDGVSSKTQYSSVKNLKKPVSESKVKGSSTLCKQDLLGMNVYKDTKNHLPLIFSKFSHVPPVINFVEDGEKIEQLPWQLRKLLRWRTSLLTPIIVKQTIARSGFRPSQCTCSGDDLDTTESSDWILYFGKHMKGPVFQTIKEYQKVNHFPGSFQLGRKDRLWRNIYRMQQESGTNEFDFIPQTFCLPTDLELFKQCWESGGNKHKWIIKPPASARGIGVKVVYKWNQIPKRRPVVVQRYISNPYLINDSKFDLRLYVFITGTNPLRIYLYDDGLVRFASTKYTNSVKSLHNRFVHLTNYSINKQNIEYLDNNDTEACKGHKWSLKSLWNYLKKRGVNIDNVWQKIKDLVIKTIISAEESINATINAYCKSNYSVQELFGFDVILDENLKPWILEVNVSPSLHSDSPLDITVKGGMLKDMFNLCGFTLPEPNDVDHSANGRSKSPTNLMNPSSDIHIDQRFWLYEPSVDEVAKVKHFITLATNGTEFRFDPCDNLPYQILDCLTPKDIRYLIEFLDEYDRRGHFERIYPICSINLSKRYLSYFERIQYSNLLVTSFLTKYRSNNQGIRLIENLCQKKLHLLSAQNGDKIDGKHVWKGPTHAGLHG